jgi:taurine dioxygenase
MAVGAEILGLVPGAEREQAVAEMLRAAWLEHGILLFRDVASIDQHLALSRVFGELELHPYPELRSSLHPLLIELGGVKRAPAYVYDERELRVNRIPWHRDSAFTPDVCKGAMLRMVTPAREDGETFFADTAAAYDDLPAAMRRRLDGLDYVATLKLEYLDRPPAGALWSTMRRATEAEDPGGRASGLHDEAIPTRYPAVVQPVVFPHPQTGRRCLLLSPSIIDGFVGLGEEESRALLAELMVHMLQPKYLYRHQWRANDALLWDNIRFMHAAPGHRIDDQRFGLRTTLAGGVHTGRYLNADAAPVSPDFAD